MIKKRNLIISIIFILIITAIPALTLAKMVVKRIPIDQYKGALVGKFQMIKFNTELTSRLTGGTYMESAEVLLGKDGWLFYKVKTDGTPLYDYMGINRFSEEELRTIDANLSGAYNAMQSNDIKFAVMTIPNKEQVYSEYMPDTVVKISNESRLDQLTGYLEDNTDGYPYIDVSELLKDNHLSHPLYYKTDTHWTEVGSFLALQEMMQNLYGSSESLDDVEFMATPGFEGDLCRISGTNYPDVTYSLVPDSIDPSLKHNETLLIVGDSFGDSMIHTAKYYYENVYWIRIKDYTKDCLTQYSPDVVLWECVERYLPDMVEYNM